jgi:hypothetical protein
MWATKPDQEIFYGFKSFLSLLGSAYIILHFSNGIPIYLLCII